MSTYPERASTPDMFPSYASPILAPTDRPLTDEEFLAMYAPARNVEQPSVVHAPEAAPNAPSDSPETPVVATTAATVGAEQQLARSAARADVAAVHEQGRLIDHIAGQYAQTMSFRVHQIGGDYSAARTGFDYRLGTAKEFWAKHPIQKAVGYDAETITDVPVEAVAFTESTEPVMEKRLVKPAKQAGLFSKAQPAQYSETEVGRQRRQIVNAATGQAEPAVFVDYSFDGYKDGDVPRQAYEDMPPYAETGGSRLNNAVQVRLEMPESVATRLRYQLAKDPQVIRRLVDRVLVESYDKGSKVMNEEIWFNGLARTDGTHYGAARPPYGQLPAGWKLHVIEPLQPGNEPLTRDPRYVTLHDKQLTTIPAPALQR